MRLKGLKKSRLIPLMVVFLFMACGTAGAWPWSWDFYHQKSHRAQEEPAPPLPAGIVTSAVTPFFAHALTEAATLNHT